MDGLQLAQVLADLSSLQEAQEAAAARNLVTANKRPEASMTTPPPSTSAPAHASASTTTHTDASGMLAPPRRPASMVRSESSEAIAARSSAAPYASGIFHHRRMLTSPPLSRCSSATPSIPGTPRREPEVRSRCFRGSSCCASSLEAAAILLLRWHDVAELTAASHTQQHDEHDKAATIMALYSLRAKLNNPDNAALSKARDKVAAIAERQRLQEQQQTQQQTHAHSHSAAASPTSATHGGPGIAQNLWASRRSGELISPRAGGSGD
jgi:hypothetical protein